MASSPKGSSSKAASALTAAQAAAATAPVFVHYNGGAKLAKWNPEVGRQALHDALLAAHRARKSEGKGGERGGGSRQRASNYALTHDEAEELDELFRRHVLLVDNHLRRVETASYSSICPSK